MEHSHPPPQSPEDDITIARAAVAEGNLKHAAFHVACALHSDPNRREWLDLLDQVIAAAPDPLELTPVGGPNTPLNLYAVHGYILARQGQPGPAADLVVQVSAARPEIPYLDWVLRWLEQPDVPLNTAVLTRILARFNDQFQQLTAPESPARATVQRMADVVRHARRASPQDPQFLWTAAGFLRRLGLLDEAMSAAEEMHALQPGYLSAMALGLVHRARGDVAKTVEYYQVCLQHEPDDIPIRLDLGDVLFDDGQLDDAERYYIEVLEREAQHPWALASVCCLRYLRTGDPGWKDRLASLARDENERAQDLHFRLAPYFAWLPEPRDAFTNQLRHLVEIYEAEGTPPEVTSMSVTSLEAPSNYLAYNQLMAGWGKKPGLQVSVEHIQDPDPREPHCAVDYRLWEYDGTTPRVVAPPPAEEAVEAVAGIAAQRYSLGTWIGLARKAAEQLGPERIQDLLAVMVDPPWPPEGWPPWAWIFRVQVAAALVIARLDKGWKDSVRRKALFSLANGPMDWTVDAAILALTVLALEDKEIAKDVVRLFRDLLDELPQDGPVCYHRALVNGALRLPQIAGREREELHREWLRLEGWVA
jgi:tetratricopeptide (TPR) repeat protein